MILLLNLAEKFLFKSQEFHTSQNKKQIFLEKFVT
jgi:hypothetical protein